MTFFDKFFTTRSRNNNKAENEDKLTTAPFSPSVFDFNKDQIRVVLFRECDKRGRKLLFDSNAIEKLPITSNIKSEDSLQMKKSDKTQNVKLDSGYRYKKPSNDVTLLGEMIFGSVAMVFKAENICKIHRLSSPKRVMFTNIVHAPEQSHGRVSSAQSFGASSDSHSKGVSECSEETRTSSSDSKLYKQKQSSKSNINTYPCIQQKYHNIKKSGHCEVTASGPEGGKGSSSQNSSNSRCSEKLYGNDRTEETSFSEGKKAFEKVNEKPLGLSKYSELSLYCSDTTQNKPESESPFSDTTQKVDEKKKGSDNADNNRGSWKRRWMQSCSSSLDEIDCEETDKVKSKPKTKTKIGMGLVVELRNDAEDELEQFLFNHSTIIESILKKLQSSIEIACIKRENFVDLTYTAFINCQRSMYELITGEKYARAMWLSLVGKMRRQIRKENKNVSQSQENVEDDKAQDPLSNAKAKFLNIFCDVLAKFDTKDTNFFISTLLTAVLTHHLSWVTEIAESDVLLPQDKLRSALKTLRTYNPIWAQLNDLYGILGSPLRCARIVVTGPESSKDSIDSIIQILTYFIRCYNVIETLYDFDVEDVTNVAENEEGKVQDSKNLDSGLSSKCDSLSELVRTKLTLGVEEEPKNTDNLMKGQVSELDIPVTEHADENLGSNNTLQTTCTSHGMKKSKSCLFPLKKDGDATVFPYAEDHVKTETIRVMDKKDKDELASDLASNYLRTNEPCKKISHTVRVPSKAVSCHLEQRDGSRHLEDCDTTATSSTATDADGGDSGKQTKSKGGVLFVLGENEELVNLKRGIRTDFESKNLRKEQGESVQLEKISQSESSTAIPSSTRDSKNDPVLRDHKDVAGKSLTESCANVTDPKCEKVDDEESVLSSFRELPMPKHSEKRYRKRTLDVSSVLGSVNYSYNSDQIVQGVLEDRTKWEKVLRKDLNLCVHDHVLDRNVTEALCIIGDMNSWEVSLISNRNFTMDKRGFSSVRVGMSQLVADMLESLQAVCKFDLPADFCLNHIERKLHEIYSKSKCVAELLNTAKVSSIEYITSKLDLSVNDVPLLLSVATTHSPHLSSRYGLTYT